MVMILKNTSLINFELKENKIIAVTLLNNKDNQKNTINIDYVLNSADYYHIENILPNKYRSYPRCYWNNLVSCPSCILFSISLDIKIPKLLFHNLFFNSSLDNHTEYIYKKNVLPPKPLFYVNITTKLFNEGPDGHETLFILIPSNPNINISQNEINRVYKYVINEISNYCNINIKKHIKFKRSFTNLSFKKFNSFKYNAYGLACDKFQNIFIRPKIKSLYVENLYYCGQMTSPGPGIAPCMVSGLNSSDLLIDNDNDLEPIRFYTWWMIMRLITHFLTIFFIIGFRRELYHSMKREFKYLIFNQLFEQNSY